MAKQKPESRFVQEVTEHTLTTYFLLPLIQLNKFSFGSANFLNCYVNRDGTKLIVEVVDLRLSLPMHLHPEYAGISETENTGCFYFYLPDVWKEDFLLFQKGQYSKFSENAKEMIRAYSGLPYQNERNGQTLTDARLLALDKSPVLRKAWEDELTVKTPVYLPDDLELLDIPGEDVYRECE